MHLPRLTRINNRGDALDRERRLRHISRENDFSQSEVRERPVLLLRRQVAEQRHKRVPVPFSQRRQCILAAHDLAHAGQEHEHVPRRLAQRLRHNRRDEIDHRPLLAATLVAHLHGKTPRVGADHRTVAQQSRNGLGGQGRTHDHDPQIGPQRLPNPHENSEREGHLDRPFVELIEHDGPDAIERDVVEQTPQQYSRRHDHEPRLAAYARVEADLIAHLVAELHAAELRNPSRNRPCG